MTKIVEGHERAQRLLASIAADVRAVQQARGRAPCLALLTIGQPSSAMAYAARIAEFAALAGVHVKPVSAPQGASLEQVRAVLKALNADDAVDGILPLAPFPASASLAQVAASLSPDKDVDGLTAHNAGQLACGLEGLFPCTPQAAILLAEDVLGDLRGLNATVVGASAHVGQPLALMLLKRGVTVTVAHIDTRDLAAACKSAQILFVAAGKAGLIGASALAPGVVIIDIGINVVDDGKGGRQIVGDVDLEAVQGIAQSISAVPDGVGPVTTAMLMVNTVRAAKQGMALARSQG